MTYQSNSLPQRDVLAPAIAATVPVPLAARVLRRRGVESLAVVDHGSVCGVLTEQDVLRAAVLYRERAGEVNVADVCCRQLGQLMTPEPLVVGEESTLLNAARAMLEAGAGSAVAVGDGEVTGVVTGGDIAAAVGEGLDPDLVTVERVRIEVAPVCLSDGLEDAAAAALAARGRPVPVVDDGQPIGTVRVPFSPVTPTVGEAEAPVVLPRPSNPVRRVRGGPRFYTRLQHARR